MRIRSEAISEKILDLEVKINHAQIKLSGDLNPPEMREVLTNKLNQMTKLHVDCLSEIQDAFDFVELKLKDI